MVLYQTFIYETQYNSENIEEIELPYSSSNTVKLLGKKINVKNKIIWLWGNNMVKFNDTDSIFSDNL